VYEKLLKPRQSFRITLYYEDNLHTSECPRYCVSGTQMAIAQHRRSVLT